MRLILIWVFLLAGCDIAPESVCYKGYHYLCSGKVCYQSTPKTCVSRSEMK